MYFFLCSHIIWAVMCEYATPTWPCAYYDIFNWKLYFLKSARSRNSDYSESRGTNPLWDFALIWSCTEKYGFLDMGDFGGVESSVESVISWSNFAVRSKGNSQKSAHIDGCYSAFSSELTPEIFCLVMCLLNACNFVHRSAGNSHRRQQYFLVYFCFLLHELFWELADFGEILPEMQTALAVGDIFIGLLYRNTGLFWENIWLLWKKPKKKIYVVGSNAWQKFSNIGFMYVLVTLHNTFRSKLTFEHECLAVAGESQCRGWFHIIMEPFGRNLDLFCENIGLFWKNLPVCCRRHCSAADATACSW